MLLCPLKFKMKKIQLLLKVILIPLDFSLCFLSFVFAYIIRLKIKTFFSYELFVGYIPDLKTYIVFSFVVSFLLVFVFVLGGIYDLKETKRGVAILSKLIYLVLVWSFLISSYFFWSKVFFFSRLVFIFGVLFTFCLVLLTRVLFDWIKDYTIMKKIFQRKILLIGKSLLNKKIIKNIQKNGEYFVLRSFENDKDLKLSEIKRYMKEKNIYEVLQTDVGRDKEFDLKLIDFCQTENIIYHFVPNIFTLQSTNIGVKTIGGIPIIELKTTPLDGWGRIYKRLFDIIFSIFMLFLLTPVFLFVSFLIKITSDGPVFVALERRRYRESFKIYKFRSMVQNAHSMKKRLLDKNERADGPLFKIKEDPRITKVGKIIRKTRIDEIPQFWNVLKGDMSIVGPRPHEPEEVDQYKKHHRKLLAIKPGITGMSQVNGASDIKFEEEVFLDVFYIENWSFLLDIKIILKTILIVFTGHGAA
jgi:exopolysaccharide biosynthesis polyprenyl glycosylphosphotransferase